MTKRRVLIFLALAFIISSTVLPVTKNVSELISKVSGILGRFPASTAPEKDVLCAELIKLGPGAIEEVCGRLRAPGDGDDSAVRFALNGLAVYVSRPGADKERALFARTLLGSLEKTRDKEVKAFLISQVQLTGGRESVKPLARYLSDERLADPAARALLAGRQPEAAAFLLRALGSLPAGARVNVIQALGELRSREAVKMLLPYAESPDQKIRQASLFALANIGDPLAGPALAKVRIAASAYERSQAPSLYLLYARRLVESGRAADGLEIARNLLKYYTASGEGHIASNALGLIVSALGDRSLPDLLATGAGPDRRLRATSLDLASSIPGREATASWAEKAADSPAEIRAEIVAMLGRRKDATALPFVRESLRSQDKEVRLAAIPAVVGLAGKDALPDILPFFQSADGEEIVVAKEAALGFEGSLIIPAAVGLMDSTAGQGRAALLDILAEKGARDQIGLIFAQAEIADQAVKTAAIGALAKLAGDKDIPRLVDRLYAASDNDDVVSLQSAIAAAAARNPDPERRADPILALTASAEGSRKAALLRLLPRVGGARALAAVIGETRSKDGQIQAVAVYSLAQWPDFSAAGELLRIITTAADKKLLLLALDGYVRLVGAADFAPGKKLELLKNVLGSLKDDADKKAILLGLSRLRGPESFALLSEFLDRPGLRPTAVEAILDMAGDQAPEERWLSGHQAVSILRRVEGLIGDPAEKERAAKVISDRLGQGGFVPLFNGRNLDGWKGLVADPPQRAKMTSEEMKKAQAAADDVMRAHWRITNGVLVFDGKGESLCTARDYADFEMLVDWKIEKGGDSGIYLRGSPQVQIWDPVANPVGSGGLYNNQKGPSYPLEKADRSLGEWNTFRIIMIGGRVTVYLNDRMVVDNTVLENYWERDKPIYPTGQIELQAHGNPLYFKNVYVREIPGDSETPGLTDAEKDEGFVPLFDGHDLAGWTGDTKGYAAENGKIVIYPDRSSGNLYTEKEFSDFLLRFEFKLTPAANNGIGIRAPLEGDAAYAGMEIQVLEDGAPVYWGLQSYQFHGSIYGVVPARRGVLRPPGVWNSEEIRANGRRVVVIVNGTKVVDADIDQASAGGTIDHRDHPGLKRERGHIGFLGHGSIVEFRSIRVKELK